MDQYNNDMLDMTNIGTASNEDLKKPSSDQQKGPHDCLIDAQSSVGLNPNEKVKLVSSDGQVFSIDFDCVMLSGTIKNLLESNPNWIENRTGILEFPCIDSKILAKVVEYMLYKRVNLQQSELVEEFFIEPEMALDMMLAADYLDL